jgi:ferredoxin-NADP reductase
VATVGAVSSSLDGAAAALPQVLVCGPEAYIAAVQALLAEAGCPKERIWVFS